MKSSWDNVLDRNALFFCCNFTFFFWIGCLDLLSTTFLSFDVFIMNLLLPCVLNCPSSTCDMQVLHVATSVYTFYRVADAIYWIFWMNRPSYVRCQGKYRWRLNMQLTSAHQCRRGTDPVSTWPHRAHACIHVGWHVRWKVLSFSQFLYIFYNFLTCHVGARCLLATKYQRSRWNLDISSKTVRWPSRIVFYGFSTALK